jgi:hypothetical protein
MSVEEPSTASAADSVRVDEVARCGIASQFLLPIREFVLRIAGLES